MPFDKMLLITLLIKCFIRRLFFMKNWYTLGNRVSYYICMELRLREALSLEFVHQLKVQALLTDVLGVILWILKPFATISKDTYAL